MTFGLKILKEEVHFIHSYTNLLFYNFLFYDAQSSPDLLITD